MLSKKTKQAEYTDRDIYHMASKPVTQHIVGYYWFVIHFKVISNNFKTSSTVSMCYLNIDTATMV